MISTKDHLKAALLFLTLCDSRMVFAHGANTVSTKGNLFQVYKGISLSGLEGEKTVKVSDREICTLLCESDSDCLSVSYDTTESMCQLNQVSLTSRGIRIDSDVEAVYMEKSKRDDWSLVFRATANIETSVYDTWTNDSYHDDEVSLAKNSIGCLTLGRLLPCNRHIRLRGLDDWNNIKQAKFGFYTNSECVFYVTFRADNIDARDEMFSMDRIVDSSVPELVGYNGTYNYDSIQGVRSVDLRRRFHINKAYAGCESDEGWMMVVEKGACDFELNAAPPVFLYAPSLTSVRWNDAFEDIGGGTAQVFAVFFKYG